MRLLTLVLFGPHNNLTKNEMKSEYYRSTCLWPIKHGLVLFINYVIRHKSESIRYPIWLLGFDALNPPLLYIFVNFLSHSES